MEPGHVVTYTVHTAPQERPTVQRQLQHCFSACLPACCSFRVFWDIFPLGRRQGLVVILQCVSKEARHCLFWSEGYLLSLSFLLPQWIMGD